MQSVWPDRSIYDDTRDEGRSEKNQKPVGRGGTEPWSVCEKAQGTVDKNTMIKWWLTVCVERRKVQENAHGEGGTGIERVQNRKPRHQGGKRVVPKASSAALTGKPGIS